MPQEEGCRDECYIVEMWWRSASCRIRRAVVGVFIDPVDSLEAIATNFSDIVSSPNSWGIVYKRPMNSMVSRPEEVVFVVDCDGNIIDSEPSIGYDELIEGLYGQCRRVPDSPLNDEPIFHATACEGEVEGRVRETESSFNRWVRSIDDSSANHTTNSTVSNDNSNTDGGD
jgi:hypothetical protein